MLKPIPKSDITIRPFKVYKEWSFDNTSTKIDVLLAEKADAFSETTLSSDSNLSFYKHSLYGQLRAQFYNGLEDNPILRSGKKSPNFNENNLQAERLLLDSAKVISVPQLYIGEEIKPGSFVLNDVSGKFVDDTNGNIIGDASFNGILVSLIDNELNIFNFEDSLGNEYSASINSIDLNAGTIDFDLESTNYNLIIVNFDTVTKIMILETAPFLPQGMPPAKIGNIFYDKGLIVITQFIESLLLSNWNISFNSTVTIYENEYFLEVKDDEFNVSTNPSATISVGSIVEDFVDSNGVVKRVTPYPGAKYIRKRLELENGTSLEYGYQSNINGNVYGGFGDGHLSQSADPTGSYLTSFVTTIGLYDNNNDLVAVAKLPVPIKCELDIPLNFIVRFDT
jgi:hypothetical protein